jgi:hypothetical protein
MSCHWFKWTCHVECLNVVSWKSHVHSTVTYVITHPRSFVTSRNITRYYLFWGSGETTPNPKFKGHSFPPILKRGRDIPLWQGNYSERILSLIGSIIIFRVKIISDYIGQSGLLLQLSTYWLHICIMRINIAGNNSLKDFSVLSWNFSEHVQIIRKETLWRDIIF